MLKTESNGRLACVNATERMIKTYGVETVAAVITEGVFGVANVLPPPEYQVQIREMCTRLGILWICDEVMMGFGRTGKWFGFSHWEMEPDILTLAKGLTAGTMPLGATVVSDKIANYFQKNVKF